MTIAADMLVFNFTQEEIDTMNDMLADGIHYSYEQRNNLKTFDRTAMDELIEKRFQLLRKIRRVSCA